MSDEQTCDPMVGRDIDGRFTITHRIGLGGMGAVYAAVQHSVGREVAIKIINPEMATEPSIARRFLRECWLASRLRSPYIAAVYDSGTTADGLLYMVMEKVEGHTLAEELRRSGALSPARAVQIAVKICRALEVAHDAGVVHRDLKPANIMLGADDSVVVLDFGLAKSFTGNNLSVTEAGIIVGTSRYLAPELIRGGDAEPTSDLYALGCVLHTMLAGRQPFVGDELAVLKAHVMSPPPRLEAPVPVALAEVIARLLEKQPARRFRSAAALREALVESLSRPEPEPTQPLEIDDLFDVLETIDCRRANLPVGRLAPPPPVPPPPTRRGWRQLALALALGALFAAMIATGAHM